MPVYIFLPRDKTQMWLINSLAQELPHSHQCCCGSVVTFSHIWVHVCGDNGGISLTCRINSYSKAQGRPHPSTIVLLYKNEAKGAEIKICSASYRARNLMLLSFNLIYCIALYEPSESNTRRYTSAHGFCFIKLFPIGCIRLNKVWHNIIIHSYINKGDKYICSLHSLATADVALLTSKQLLVCCIHVYLDSITMYGTTLHSWVKLVLEVTSVSSFVNCGSATSNYTRHVDVAP